MSDTREAAKAAGELAKAFLGHYAGIFMLAAMILAPMPLAAALGFVVAAPDQWVEAALGGLIGLGVFALVSYRVYRYWRRWSWRWRSGLIAFQLFVLIGALVAGQATFDKVKKSTCDSLFECVALSVEQFWNEDS